MNYNQLFIETNLPKPLTKDQTYEYFKKYQTGDKSAKKEIINHNIRLVINIVMTKYSSVPYEKKDLISIGLIGLVKSVNTFNTKKNVEFLIYATKCINNEILMFLRKYKKYINDDSLNRPIGFDKENKEIKLEDILVENSSHFTFDYEDKETYERILKIIEELPDREREIIMLNFGFIGDRSYTQYEIAEKFNITQSYVCRIVKKIVIKIRKTLAEDEKIKNLDKAKIQKMIIKK